MSSAESGDCLICPGQPGGEGIHVGASVVVGHWPWDGVVPLLVGPVYQVTEPVTAEDPQHKLPGIALPDVLHHVDVELWVGLGLLDLADFEPRSPDPAIDM